MRPTPALFMIPNASDRPVRPAAQAGRFYPASPSALGGMVEGFLREAVSGGVAGAKGLVAPHAGYVYSGPVAGSAFAAWAGAAGTIRRVVVMGPSHFVDFAGVALPGVSALATPLGTVEVDAGGVAALEGCPGVTTLPAAHSPEHCVEVELPFLQVVLGEFRVVPLVVGRCTDDQIVEVMERLWGGPETGWVISSDLSHYLPPSEARAMDLATAHAVEELNHEVLTGRHACGFRPLRGLMRCVRSRGGSMRTVDLRNSGDTAGPRDSVVGYGAFHLDPEGVPRDPVSS